MMRIVQAIVAIFTVVLLFIQQTYVSVCAGPCPSLPARPPSSGDAPFTPLPLLPADCVVCARAARCHQERGRPKYKRDPEITVDNEFIGYPPYDDDL